VDVAQPTEREAHRMSEPAKRLAFQHEGAERAGERAPTPAGRSAIQGGGSPAGGSGSATPGATARRMKAGRNWSTGRSFRRFCAAQNSRCSGVQSPAQPGSAGAGVGR
jgi:hypothetical protein